MARAGRALTLAEHRDAFAATGAEMPTSYEAMFFSLVRRNVLVTVGGRSGHTRYAPADAALPGLAVEAVDDEAMWVLDALRTVCVTHQRAATTREVAEVLKARGHVIGGGHPNAVRKRLETLCAERQNGHKTWYAPRVRRETVANGLGRPSARWIAVDAPQPVAPDVAATIADAVRELVDIVGASCHRPVDAGERVHIQPIA